MRVPGFSAEAGIYRSSTQYRAHARHTPSEAQTIEPAYLDQECFRLCARPCVTGFGTTEFGPHTEACLERCRTQCTSPCPPGYYWSPSHEPGCGICYSLDDPFAPSFPAPPGCPSGPPPPPLDPCPIGYYWAYGAEGCEVCCHEVTGECLPPRC
jgi:hypothetical protein